MFRTVVVEKMFGSITFCYENRAAYDCVEKCCRAVQVTDGNLIWRMRIACWILRATNTHLVVYYSLLFHSNNGRTNPPQCYVIRTLPQLFYFDLARFP